MKSTSEVLSLFPGMSRDFLYYIEAAHFIEPSKEGRGRVLRRWYDDETVERISLAWRFYQRGFPPKRAFEMALGKLTSKSSNTKELSFWDFFRKTSKQTDLAPAVDSLMDLGVLNAPGEQEETTRSVFFAAATRNLAEAARRMTLHLLDTTFIVVADEIASLLAGACSLALGDLRPDDIGPLVILGGDLARALTCIDSLHTGEGVIIVGYLQRLAQIATLVEEVTAANLPVRKVIALRSALAAQEEAHLRDRGLILVYLFGAEETDNWGPNSKAETG